MGKAAAIATLPAGNALLPHKLAQLVPGDMDGKEFEALCTSLQEDGQCNPIMLFEGAILDGNHRYRALTKLGITPRVEEFKGDAKAAAAFVLDNNLHRRQLNAMQKGLVGARMHLDSRSNPETEAKGKYAITQEVAAARVGVAPTTINTAVRLLNSNNTSLIHRCELGELSREQAHEDLWEPTDKTTAVVPGALVLGDDEEDDTPAGPRTLSDNVVPIRNGSGVSGTKPGHAERRATETPASHAVQVFKALAESERKAFVSMAWGLGLEQAVRAAGKTVAAATAPAPRPVGPTKAKPAKPGNTKLVPTAKAKAKAPK